MRRIRLVSFDAFQTLLLPRQPIFTQYQQIFTPYLGVLDPDAIKRSFKLALKQVQKDKPAFAGEKGARRWWGEVIERTALGAGADPVKLAEHQSTVTRLLMHRFSSDEGYMLFDDTLPACKCALRALQEMGVRTALLSNSDSRMHSVLHSLGITPYLRPILLSDETGVEKPHREMFQLLFQPDLRLKAALEECVHVGDELDCDYKGALASGLHALLLRRPGAIGEGERKEPGEDLTGIEEGVVRDLGEVVNWVKGMNGRV